MQAILCKHPSESEYTRLKLIDTKKVPSKHYAVAMDIYDTRTTGILQSFLNILGGHDTVTLVTFGLHYDSIQFTRQQCIDNQSVATRVNKLISRTEHGLNTLVGIRMLEKIKADEFILITAGFQDRAPDVEMSTDICVLVPGETHFLKHDNITLFPENSPYERIIRRRFNIPQQLYFNIVLDSVEGVRVPSLPRGGSRTIELPESELIGLSVMYMLSDGTEEQIDCELQDDETVPFKSEYMKECDMVE